MQAKMAGEKDTNRLLENWDGGDGHTRPERDGEVSAEVENYYLGKKKRGRYV